MRSLWLAASVAFLLAACAGTPERVPEIDQARAAIQRLEAEDRMGQVAAQPLSSAREALARAEAALEQGEPLPDIQHQAYLARRHAEIGLAMVNEAKAIEKVRAGEARRREMQLEARTQEAERAEAAAEESRAAAAAAMQEAERLQRELADLEAEQTARGLVVSLGSEVLFETSSAELKSGAELALDRLADFLKAHPERRLLIEGHTDARGTEEYNEALSERRAKAVVDALVARGIEPERLRAVGLGEGYPVASNDTDAGRQQNRRVEVVVSDREGRFPAEARRSVARRGSG